jgi:protein disulfide-isomerase A1
MGRSIVYVFFVVVSFFILSLVLGASEPGKVNVLKDDTISEEVATGYWLVEFYAPWCTHCKQLAPILNDVARDIESSEELRIGKVDCIANKQSTSDYNISGFPTLLYFKHGITGKYEGPRTREALTTFMLRMATPILSELPDMSELRSFYEIHPIAFCLTVPSNDYLESVAWKTQFETVAKRMHLHATFVTHTSSAVTVPTISKHENGRDSVVFVKKGAGPISVSEIEEFVEAHNIPFMNRFDSHNFKKLGSLKKVLAMVVVDPSKAAVADNLIQHLDASGSALKPADRDKFVFGSIDGVKWSKFMRQYGVESVPSVVLLDLTVDKFIAVPLAPEAAAGTGTETSPVDHIASVLEGYLAGNLQMKEVEKPGIIGKAIIKMKKFYPWSILCVLPICFVVLSFFLPYPEETKEKKA